MPKASPIQTNFTGGIQTPLLDGHIDAPRRASSFADSTNLIPLKHGPLVRRGGTKIVSELRVSTGPAYLYAFEFNDEQAYILEFTEDPVYGSIMRVYRNNAMVFRSTTTFAAEGQVQITGITDASPPVVTGVDISTGTDLPTHYTATAIVYLSGLTEATELNDRFWRIKARLSSTTFSIMEYDGTTEILGLSAAETSNVINAITQADPAVVTTTAAHGYSTGDSVRISAVVGMTQVNNRDFVMTVLTTTTFELDGEDSITHIAYSSAGIASNGGVSDRPMNLVLPYCTGEVFRTDGSFIPKLVQSNDVIYMTHPDYATRVITRTANDAWTIAIVNQDNGPYQENSTGVNIISSFLGTTGLVSSSNYWVRRWRFNQVMFPIRYTAEITGASNANPCVITAVAHPFSNGDIITIDDIAGPNAFLSAPSPSMHQLNGRNYTVANKNVDDFQLSGIDTTDTALFTPFDGTVNGGIAFTPNTYDVAMDGSVFARTDTTYATSINYITKTDPALIDIRPIETTDKIEDGDKVTITAVTDMWEVNARTFTVANIAYLLRPIVTATAVSPAVFGVTAHGLSAGNIVFLDTLTGGTWSTLDDVYYTVTAPVNTNDFTLTDPYGVAVDGTGLGTYTGSSGTANTTQFNLTDPCTGDDIDATTYTAAADDGSIRRGQTDRSLRIRFENGRSETRWLWGRISKFHSANHIEWTVDLDEKTPHINWLRKFRNDFHDNGVYPTGPGGSRELDSLAGGASVSDDHNVLDGGDDWQLGAYSDTTDYPSVVTIHQGRVVLGASDSKPRRLDFTQTGGFDTTSLNFAPTTLDGQVVDNMAISLEVGGGDGSPIQWIQSIDRGLGVGSTNNEGIVKAGGAGAGSSITPGNATFDVQSSAGSASIQPIVIGKSLLHIQRVGRRILELSYGIESDGYSALDLTELAEHLTRSGIIDFAWQQNPIDTLWCVLDNGGLIALTYDRAADVVGWHHHTIGGTAVSVESVAVIPSSDLTRDELWLSVSRTIDGSTRRYVEYMERWYENDIGIRNAYHVDSGKTYDATTVTTLTNMGGTNTPILGIDATGSMEVSGAGGTYEGAYVYIEDVCGMTEINGRVYKLDEAVVGPTTFHNLLDVDGNDFDVSSFGTYLAGGTVTVVGDSTAAKNNEVTVTTDPAHGLSDGDVVRFTSVTGMTVLNGRYYKVVDKTSTTFALTYTDGERVENRIGDALSLGALSTTSGSYQKCESTFGNLYHLEGETVTILRDGQTHADEIVCNGSVELGTKSVKNITAITKDDPALVSAATHGFSNGDKVYITGVQGMTEVNDNCYIVANKAAGTFELNDFANNNVDSNAFTTYICNGTASVSDQNLYGGTVHIGLGTSWFLNTLRLEAGSATGTAQGKTKRIDQVVVRLRDTLNLQYGPNADDLIEEVFDYGTVVSGEPVLFTGDKEFRWPGGYEKEGQMYFKGEGPYPVQIQSIMPQVNTQDG